MKVLVLNGSPKGKYSITLQTVLYLQKKCKSCEFEILNVGQTIKQLEKDFTVAKEMVENADILLFSYPVYTFIAPCQLHRFIELMKEYKLNVEGKFATQLTTSKHFYDVTAHRYVMENCQDMGMKFVRGFSADMEDLIKEKGQREAIAFWKYVLFCVKKDIYEAFPQKPELPDLVQATVPECMGAPANEQDRTAGPEAEGCEKGTAVKLTGKKKEVVIITDCESDNTVLQNMIARFMAKLPCASRVVNIREYPFRGGCLGCFNCAVSGKCIYIDGFDEFLRNDIQTADAMVYAFSIKDHSMGAVFKMYDDRQFCNGHRTVTMGMPIGYLISGHYSQEENLRMIVEGRAEVGSNFLAGVATDEFNTDKSIDDMAKKLYYAMKRKYVQPQNFFGVGGMKIFRDLIYLMQGMMKADHKFYKEHKQYDFPQKQKGTLLKMYLVGALISNPKIKAKMGNKMNEGMLAPYKKVLDKE